MAPGQHIDPVREGKKSALTIKVLDYNLNTFHSGIDDLFHIFNKEKKKFCYKKKRINNKVMKWT